MYLEFYGLKEKPFSLTPDTQFLFLSESHRKAMEYLLYGISRKEGFIVMTGNIGTGKTTLCRTILRRLEGQVRTAVIFNSFLTEKELLKSILLDFGYSPKRQTRKELIDALNELLIHYLSIGENAVLIIDEAQNLSPAVLEQIRMLSNLETEKEKILQIILVGQPELDEKLHSPKLKQLNQRIAIRCHLSPLTLKETESYIYQRLIVAGSKGQITFSSSAINEIYQFSQGIPRLINLICDRALLGGFVEESFHIDREIVKKAEREIRGEEKEIYHKPQLSHFPSFFSFRTAFWVILILILSLILFFPFEPFPPTEENVSKPIEYLLED
ncbi:MAG: ExeA family protein [Thermodesulfobacteriota bacterium]